MEKAAIAADNLSVYQEAMAEHVRKALSQTTFSNRMLIAPRRLQQIGTEEVETAVAFLKHQDRQMVIEHGYQLANEGLGRASVFAMSTALRRTCWDSQITGESSALFDLIEEYTTAFLEGYLTGLEEEIRQEQERTRQAYLRSIER